MAVSRTHVHAHVPSVHYEDEGLLGVRRATDYNEPERQYSILLYTRIELLLKGQQNDLLILRKYPAEAGRLGAMPTPIWLDRFALRIDRVERMATDVLVFLSARASGGPIAQQIDEDGRLFEIRKYPTRFPHIVIERLDVYRAAVGSHDRPEYIQWHARRLQNQRRTMRVNQMLDIANLGVEAAKLLLQRP